MDNTCNKNSLSSVDVDHLLKAQESQLKDLIVDVYKQNDERVLNHSQSLNGEIYMLSVFSKECHELLAKQMEESKVFLQTQITNIRVLLDSEGKKFDEKYVTLHKKVDAIAEATTGLIEYISSFNKDHMVSLQDTKNGDTHVSKFEEFLPKLIFCFQHS